MQLLHSVVAIVKGRVACPLVKRGRLAFFLLTCRPVTMKRLFMSTPMQDGEGGAGSNSAVRGDDAV